MSFYALPVHMGTDRNMIIKHPPEHFAMESNISSHRESERQRQSERERERERERESWNSNTLFYKGRRGEGVGCESNRPIHKNGVEEGELIEFSSESNWRPFYARTGVYME